MPNTTVSPPRIIRDTNSKVLDRIMADKPLEWLDSSKEDLMDLPVEVQRKTGFELRSI